MPLEPSLLRGLMGAGLGAGVGALAGGEGHRGEGALLGGALGAGAGVFGQRSAIPTSPRPPGPPIPERRNLFGGRLFKEPIPVATHSIQGAPFSDEAIEGLFGAHKIGSEAALRFYKLR